MEFGPKDDFPVTTENDEIDDGVGMTDLADERIIYPKSTSNSNQNDCLASQVHLTSDCLTSPHW